MNTNADLTNADLRDADLSFANLTNTDLTNVQGISSLSEEIEFAKYILSRIEAGEKLEMSRWHTCETSHCIAGFLDNSELPAQAASRKVPHLARFFNASNEVALIAIKKVANGDFNFSDLL